MKATKKPAAKKRAPKDARRQGRHLERVARRMMRYLSALKLRRSLAGAAFSEVREIAHAEDALVAAVSEKRLRAAINAAIELTERVENTRQSWELLH